jgi:phosphatidate cytidylyltransferase
VDETVRDTSPAGLPEPSRTPAADESPAAASGVAPDPRPGEKPGKISRSLHLRLLSAAVIVPTVIGLILWGGVPFLLGVVTIIVIALHEFYEIIELKGLRPLKLPGLVGATLLALVTFLSNEYQTNVLLTAVFLVVMILQLLKQDVAEAIGSISATFFGVFYVGWLMAHAILLRRMDDVLRTKYEPLTEGPFWIGPVYVNQYLGVFLLLFCICCVAGGDIGAYFTGRRFGRTKLAPRVSPNKTVEGAIGGVATGVVFGLIVWTIFRIWVFRREVLPVGQALLLGLVLAAIGILGDLAESLIKRDARAKDAGTLIPGMGGMLDRIDSNMVAFPVLYYWMNAWFFLKSLGG